jgi:hypothetical protein
MYVQNKPTHMQFHHIKPHPLLKNYIERLWVFETSGPMPHNDVKLVVPNGRIKLTVPLKNSFVATLNNHSYFSKGHDITLTGLTDLPLILNTNTKAASGAIGIELSPIGAHRFFPFALHEIKNKIFPLSEVLGGSIHRLEERISNVTTVSEKIEVLQKFLIQQLQTRESDLIFEYCVEQIERAKGKISIAWLEEKTGYSSRWLNMKFKNKLGISPKSFASIIRFKQYYQAVANKSEAAFMQNQLFEYYYDQSHFSKDFRRFTGLPYRGFSSINNEFGKSFYTG